MLSHFAAKKDDEHTGSIRQKEVACSYCNEQFSIYQSRRVTSGKNPNNTFCSRQCRSKFYGNRMKNREQTSCRNCGKEIERRLCEIENTTFSVCSDKCYSEVISGESSPHWEGGHPDYGKFWSSGIRDEVIERDFNCCRLCRMSKDKSLEIFGRDLEVHHKRAIRSYEKTEEANKMSNLITLCKSCHSSVEANEVSL